MVPAPMPTMPSSGPASATPLLGESWRAASPLTPAPALLAFPPVALVGFFVPLTPVMGLPLWRRLTTPSCPGRRGHGVVADGDLENGRRNVHRLDVCSTGTCSPGWRSPQMAALVESWAGTSQS